MNISDFVNVLISIFYIGFYNAKDLYHLSEHFFVVKGYFILKQKKEKNINL